MRVIFSKVLAGRNQKLSETRLHLIPETPEERFALDKYIETPVENNVPVKRIEILFEDGTNMFWQAKPNN